MVRLQLAVDCDDEVLESLLRLFQDFLRTRRARVSRSIVSVKAPHEMREQIEEMFRSMTRHGEVAYEVQKDFGSIHDMPKQVM